MHGVLYTFTERVFSFCCCRKKWKLKKLSMCRSYQRKNKRKIKIKINSITYDNGKEILGFKRTEKTLILSFILPIHKDHGKEEQTNMQTAC